MAPGVPPIFQTTRQRSHHDHMTVHRCPPAARLVADSRRRRRPMPRRSVCARISPATPWLTALALLLSCHFRQRKSVNLAYCHSSASRRRTEFVQAIKRLYPRASSGISKTSSQGLIRLYRLNGCRTKRRLMSIIFQPVTQFHPVLRIGPSLSSYSVGSNGD